MGNYSEALLCSYKALHMLLALYGEGSNHPSIALRYYDTGKVHSNFNEHAIAIESYEKALSILFKAFGENANHPFIAANYNSIGSVHNRMGDYAKALEYYLKSLNMRTALYGEKLRHPDIANNFNNIAVAYSNVGDYKSAIEYHEKSLNITFSRGEASQTSAKSNNQIIADSYTSLAEVYSRAHHHTNASTCYSLALKASLNSLSTVELFVKLSKFLIGQSSHKFALQFLKCAQNCDMSSKYVCEVQHLKGVCYMHMHSWRKSWSCLYLALRTYPSSSHYKPSMLAQVHLSIGQLFLHIGYTSQSLEHSQLALDLARNLLDNSKCTDYIKLFKEIRSLRDSLHLVKICQYYQFFKEQE